MIALAGGAGAIEQLGELQELYLGLVAFTDPDGAHPITHSLRGRQRCSTLGLDGFSMLSEKIWLAIVSVGFANSGIRLVAALSLRSCLRRQTCGCARQRCEPVHSAGTVVEHKPSVACLAALTNLQALTLVHGPFAVHSAAVHSDEGGHGGAPPLATALLAMPSLTKLRIGRSRRLSEIAGAPGGGDAAEASSAGMREVYAALRELELAELTVDCDGAFGAKELAAVLSNRGLKVCFAGCSSVML